MRTDRADAEHVEQSLQIAADRAGDLTGPVCARLFARQPEMKELFWRDGDGAIKGEMLMRVFEAILDFIGERTYADRLIQCEVITHEGYDAPRQVFATFFGVVADTVEEACGEAWSADIEGAWRRLLVDLDHYVAHPEQAAA